LGLVESTNCSFLNRFGLNVNYTYQQAKFRGGDYGGNEMPMIPSGMFSVGLKTKFLENYGFSLLGKYANGRYAINDTRHERSKIKGYFVLDSRMLYEKESLEIYVGINNIFNERYHAYAAKSATATRIDHYPAPERNFEMGMQYKF